jgi:hypothetical protein
MLMNHCNAVLQTCARRRQNYSLTITCDVAIVWLIQAAQHCSQSAFAGAVLSEKSVNFARLDIEINGIVGENAREPF